MEKFPGTLKNILGGAINGKLTELRLKAKKLVTSLVKSRIDYCNVVLAGLPALTIAPLQRVQNAAARLVLRVDRRSHITLALRYQ